VSTCHTSSPGVDDFCDAPPAVCVPSPDDLQAMGYTRYRDLYMHWAQSDARINFSAWNPSNGFPANDATVRKVYAFYQSLWDQNHKLEWAGMAKLAGAPVYAALEDVYTIRLLLDRGDPIESLDLRAQVLARLGSGELRFLETKLMIMQKEIFSDLAWQHEAYALCGIDAINAIHADGDLMGNRYTDWLGIAYGDDQLVQNSNEDILSYEQGVVVQHDYDDIRNRRDGEAFVVALSLTVNSPIPNSVPFRQYLPHGDLTLYADRWSWISGDMFPKYIALLDSGQPAVDEIDLDLASRAQRYRFAPELPYP
jgi:hypothetical protein